MATTIARSTSAVGLVRAGSPPSLVARVAIGAAGRRLSSGSIWSASVLPTARAGQAACSPWRPR